MQRLTGLQSRPASGALDESADPAYRLVSIAAARAPSGCAGKDWFVYRITQGRNNLITGYRRGDLRTATAAVEQIVINLNERRLWAKGARTRTKHTRPPRPVIPLDGPESSPDKST